MSRGTVHGQEPVLAAHELDQQAHAPLFDAAKAACRPADWMPSAADVGAAVPAVQINGMLIAAGWSGNGPYIQGLAVADLRAAQNGDIGLAQTATAEQREAARNALLSVTGQADGRLTLTADGDKPTLDIPVTVIILG